MHLLYIQTIFNAISFITDAPKVPKEKGVEAILGKLLTMILCGLGVDSPILWNLFLAKVHLLGFSRWPLMGF